MVYFATMDDPGGVPTRMRRVTRTIRTPSATTGRDERKSRLGTAIVDRPPMPMPSILRRHTKVVRFDPGSGSAFHWGATLVAAVIGL